MNQRNYQREMEEIVAEFSSLSKPPRLLLHVCCAPCLSGCVEYLCSHFAVTAYYYNPNISPATEEAHRRKEVERLIQEMSPILPYPPAFAAGPYEPERFTQIAAGLENAPEGGERCVRCFALRLRTAHQEALRRNCQYLTTTLTIGPRKSADQINAIGKAICRDSPVCWLPCDFKKKDGFLRSLQRSKEYGLYRQNYCGCVYSRQAQQYLQHI